MRKIDEIYKFINENSEWNKETIIKKVLKKFNISQASAQAYYYMWKKEFMKGANCVPKKSKNNLETKVETYKEEVKSNLRLENGKVIKGKHGVYIKEGKKVIAGEEVFKSVEDLEIYKKKEIALFYERLSEIYDVFELEV